MRNISLELHLFKDFLNLSGLDHIENDLIIIKKRFYEINRIFNHIIQHNSYLSNEFLRETLNEVRN
jgi:hypothetical protein